VIFRRKKVFTTYKKRPSGGGSDGKGKLKNKGRDGGRFPGGGLVKLCIKRLPAQKKGYCHVEFLRQRGGGGALGGERSEDTSVLRNLVQRSVEGGV